MRYSFSCIAAAAAMSLSCSQDTMDENTLWYTSPATMWEEALPAGNGRMEGKGEDTVQ